MTDPRPGPAPVLGILLVHDDPGMLYWLLRVLRNAGHRVVADTNLTEALLRLREDRTIGMLVADWHLGQDDAAALVQDVRRRDPHFPCLVVTAQLASLSRIRHRLPPDVLTLFTPVRAEAVLEAVTELWERVPSPPPDVLPPRVIPPPPPALTDAVILVVDDDDAVRRLTLRILAREGYAVLEARNGNEALTILRHLVVPLQLVVSDVMMPGMSGRTLGEHLAREYPGLPILYVSGHDATQDKGVPPLTPLVAKPFAPGELVEAVRALL